MQAMPQAFFEQLFTEQSDAIQIICATLKNSSCPPQHTTGGGHNRRSTGDQQEDNRRSDTHCVAQLPEQTEIRTWWACPATLSTPLCGPASTAQCGRQRLIFLSPLPKHTTPHTNYTLQTR